MVTGYIKSSRLPMIGQLYDAIIVRLRVLIRQIIIERKVTLTW